jgi:hypothetical protein
MSARTLFGRLVLALIALVLAAPVALAQEQGEYSFESIDDGGVVLSDVRLAVLDAGHGDYVVMITFVPTQAEIDSLLQVGSHVDFEITLLGLERSGERDDFGVAPSDYVRHIGAEVDWESSDGPVVRVFGMNIEKRWVAGEAITVTAVVFGLEPDGDVRPGVEVELVSSTWWFADGDCEVAYDRERNDVVEEFCTDQGPRSQLVDEYGDARFRFD